MVDRNSYTGFSVLSHVKDTLKLDKVDFLPYYYPLDRELSESVWYTSYYIKKHVVIIDSHFETINELLVLKVFTKNKLI